MSPTITAISQVFDALGRVPLIVGALTKGTLLILIAVGLTRALSNAPAAARHLVWSLAVAGMLLLPVTTLIPWRLELTALAAARDALDVTPPATQPSPHADRRRRDHGSPSRRRNAAATSDQHERPATSSQLPSPRSPIPSPHSLIPRPCLFSPGPPECCGCSAGSSSASPTIRRIVRNATPASGPTWQSLVESARSRTRCRADCADRDQQPRRRCRSRTVSSARSSCCPRRSRSGRPTVAGPCCCTSSPTCDVAIC